MRRPAVLALAAVAVVALAGGGFALFERNERGGLVKKAERSCDGRTTPEAGAPSSLPLDLPLPEGGTILSTTEQGSTSVAFVHVEGTRDDLVDVRDAVLEQLEGAGYEVVDTDQEPGYEAEAEVEGTHEGTIKVTPLCEGRLEVRYAISA